ncbi:MAG: hypothetical protein ACFB0G_19225 [Leptolyngbyaceae cyanobacterium]
MFVSKEIVFIELHKTGSSHIDKLLAQVLSGRKVGKHNPATADLFNGNRSFIGSVRNPWEWYVSLWAYGCNRRGGIFKRVTRPKGQIKTFNWRKSPLESAYLLATDFSRDRDFWLYCYSDVNDPSVFQAWLKMIHSKKSRNDHAGGYGFSGISDFSGLLTYRYLKLFCANPKNDGFKRILNYEELKEFESQNCYIDHFIRNEFLEEDFIKTLEKCGVALSDEQEMEIKKSGKTNASSGKKEVDYYYNDETSKFVGEIDKLIVEKFGYKPPKI